MNEKVVKHKAICDELNALYARKNHDYGDSFHQTFVEEGMAMPRILPLQDPDSVWRPAGHG